MNSIILPDEKVTPKYYNAGKNARICSSENELKSIREAFVDVYGREPCGGKDDWCSFLLGWHDASLAINKAEDESTAMYRMAYNGGKNLAKVHRASGETISLYSLKPLLMEKNRKDHPMIVGYLEEWYRIKIEV